MFVFFHIGTETVQGFVSLVPIELSVTVRRSDQREIIRFTEVEIAFSLVSLGPVDKSTMESYLCKSSS